MALLAALQAGAIAAQLGSPQILRSFVDGATSGRALDALTRAALLFIGVALLQQLFAAYGRYVGEDVAWTATNGLRTDLAAHCLRLDLGFHKQRPPGEIIERIDGDVNALSTFFSSFVIDLLSNGVLLAGALVLLYREDWRVGLGLTAFAAFALLTLIGIRNVAVPHWAAVRQASASFYGFLGEQLAGTEDVRANGATAYVMRRFHQLLRPWLPLQRNAGLASGSLWMTTLTVFAVGHALAFGLGAALWRADIATIGAVVMIFQYTELLRRPIEQIRTQMQDLQKAAASIGRVEALFAIRSTLQDGPGRPLPDGPLAVEFDGVSFGYDDEEMILRDVAFRLEAGKVLGLLGRTGSGKTTLARLLLRLYDPTQGELRLGGASTRDASLSDLRRRVGLVTQDVQIFHASVRDNLTFFNPAIPDERLWQVMGELGLSHWCRSLPAGLDTQLALGGGGLSAGEAQLLALARLFLRDPGLIILDEASSRLDAATEQLLEQAVGRLLSGRTGIVIAHRLATVQRADAIMILEGGRILEYGERERLAGDPASRFSSLLRTGLEEVLA